MKYKYKTERNRCLFPKCVKREQCRGLCVGHYQVAAGYVRRGKTTWSKLEKSGKAMKTTNMRTGQWFLE